MFLPAFFLGLLGVFIGVQLTRSMARCTEPVQAAPTDGLARTAALCLSTVVPAAAAIAWLVWLYAVSAAWPNPPTALTAGDLAAIRAAGVVCASVGRCSNDGRALDNLPRSRSARRGGLVRMGAASTLGLTTQASRLGTLIC